MQRTGFLLWLAWIIIIVHLLNTYYAPSTVLSILHFLFDPHNNYEKRTGLFLFLKFKKTMDKARFIELKKVTRDVGGRTEV